MSKHLSTPRRARGIVASFAAVALGLTGLVALATTASATPGCPNTNSATGWVKTDLPPNPEVTKKTVGPYSGKLIVETCVKSSNVAPSYTSYPGGVATAELVSPATNPNGSPKGISHYSVRLVPAAHNATLTGQATCADRDGNFTITWTLTGDAPGHPMTGWWTNESTAGLDIVGGGAAYTGATGNIFAGPYDGGSTQTATTSHNLAAVPGSSVAVEGKVIWNKGQPSQYVKSVGAQVSLPTGCEVPVTPPAPETKPTCDDPGTFTAVDTPNYTWTRSEDAGTGVVTLTAVAVGYLKLTEPTVFKSSDLRQLTGEQCDEPGYVTVAWRMPGWEGPTTPTWPQELFTSVKTTEPELGALDDQLTGECGYFQVDVYNDDDITKSLLEGGFLTKPNNPPESLIGGGWGVAYKLVNNGECIDEGDDPPADDDPPVDESDDPPTTEVEPSTVTQTSLAETGFPLLGVLGLAGSFSLIGGGLVNARRLLRKSA